MAKDWTLPSGTNVLACVRSSALNLDYAIRSGDSVTLRTYARDVCLQLDALVGEMTREAAAPPPRAAEGAVSEEPAP